MGRRCRPNLPDEADNHVVELAVVGGSEVIVTHDTRDFARQQVEALVKSQLLNRATALGMPRSERISVG